MAGGGGGKEQDEEDLRAEAKGGDSKWGDDDGPKKVESKAVATAAGGERIGEGKDEQEDEEEEEFEGLVQKVARFFFEDDEFANGFESWVNDRAYMIDLSTDECKLEYTELHEQFIARFEAKVAAYIESCGSTIMDFYELVKQGSEKDPWGEESVFALILVATTDFDVFMTMMREAALKQKVEKEKDATTTASEAKG